VTNVLQFENFPTRTFEWKERILNFLDDLSQVINQNELSQIKMNLGFCKVIWGQIRPFEVTVQMFLFTTLKLFPCSFWVLYFQTRRHELVTGHHLSRILDSEMFPKICVYYWLNFNYVIVWYVMTYLSIISEPALYSKIYVAYEIKRRCHQGCLWPKSMGRKILRRSFSNKIKLVFYRKWFPWNLLYFWTNHGSFNQLL